MDERAEARRPVPQRRWTVSRDDRLEVSVAIRQLSDSAFETGLIQSNDQTTVPCSVKPPAGSASNGLPSTPRSHARAFSPSDGR